MAFSENLQFIRAQAGLTQEQLAEQLDVSRQSVSKWEGGGSFPEMETLLQICDLFGVNLDTLLRGSVAHARQEDTAGYNAFMDRFSRQIAGGSAGIVAGLAGMLALMAAFPSDRGNVLSVTVFLMILTVCVVVLVASGIQNSNFRKNHPSIPDFYTQAQKEAFRQRFVWYVSGGVGAILFGVTALIGAFAFLPQEELYELGVTAGFLAVVAGAVYVLVYAGIQDSKYNIRVYNRDNDPAPEAKKRQALIGTVCGVIMMLCTAVYLGLGFTQSAWGTAWWVFPVGGILCGVVSAVLDPYREAEG